MLLYIGELYLKYDVHYVISIAYGCSLLYNDKDNYCPSPIAFALA